MKIGIDARASSWYRGTGIGTYTYQLMHNICQMDKLNNYLFFLTEDILSELTPDENIAIKTIGETKRENFWEEIDIPNILNDTGIDAYFVPQNGIGLPVDKTCPFVITLHDIIPYRLPETVGPQYLKIYTDEIPSIIKRCDGIITVSEYSKQDIIKELDFPSEKIFVTHLAAEDIYFPRDRITCREYIKSIYSIADDFILYVGGFSPRKNIAGLIEAFSIAKPKLNENVKLVILGKKGRSYYNYRDLAISLNVKNDVIFPGYIPVTDLPIFYNAAKVFCYPSFYEGFGLPPLEAMACGTPVISSNVTSMPEILSDGVRYINPYDVNEISDSLIDILSNEQIQESYYFKGLSISNKYSWKNTAIETINIIKKIVYSQPS